MKNLKSPLYVFDEKSKYPNFVTSNGRGVYGARNIFDFFAGHRNDDYLDKKLANKDSNHAEHYGVMDALALPLIFDFISDWLKEISTENGKDSKLTALARTTGRGLQNTSMAIRYAFAAVLTIAVVALQAVSWLVVAALVKAPHAACAGVYNLVASSGLLSQESRATQKASLTKDFPGTQRIDDALEFLAPKM